MKENEPILKIKLKNVPAFHWTGSIICIYNKPQSKQAELLNFWQFPISVICNMSSQHIPVSSIRTLMCCGKLKFCNVYFWTHLYFYSCQSTILPERKFTGAGQHALLLPYSVNAVIITLNHYLWLHEKHRQPLKARSSQLIIILHMGGNFHESLILAFYSKIPLPFPNSSYLLEPSTPII